MIRSSKITLKFSNTGKLKEIETFISEYRKILIQSIDLLWGLESVPSLIPKEITDKIQTNLSRRIVQCAAKQASGIVRGTKEKQRKRFFIINKLKEKGHSKKAKKLETIYNKTLVSKPIITDLECELDERFVKIDLENSTSFDGWITVSSIGGRQKIKIPFKRTKHFNKLFEMGLLKKGIRLSENQITFNFEIKKPEIKQSGTVLGIDIGQTTAISCSDGTVSQKNIHGYDLKSITEKLSRKKKGSKAFGKTQNHRKNFINWTINQLNFDKINVLKLENIKNLRKHKKFNRTLGHWTYTEIFSKLESKCEQSGVQIDYISPTYTSKRCSHCGWTCRSNRKGKLFKCSKCGHAVDADLNASRNIAANLKPIGYKKRHIHDVKNGFYWNEYGKEFIVPSVREN